MDTVATPIDEDRYEIVVVRHGTLESTRAHLYLNYADYGQPDAPMRIDYYFWVIRGAHRTVLVDLGFDPAEATRRGRRVLCSPPEVWRELGVEPATFDGDIVLTHGHWDHTGHIAAFPRARFVLTRAEYAFWTSDASAPAPLRRLAGEPDLAALAAADAEGRVHLVDGTAILAPGIRLRPGVGHTPGLLMVEVDTATGPVLLASDATHFDEELECDMPFRYMTDLVASFRTFAALRAHTGLVLPGHEPELLDRFPRLPGPLAAHAAVVGAPDRLDDRGEPA